ncbi:MAG: UDP-N-acetylmuramoyl-L-alanyl-D-glutamate--2,6-diaminopimelate ligase [Vulcanimicrobiaceae bacterium]
MTASTLAALLAGIDGVQLSGDAGVPITSLAIDSREVQPGALFIALRGEHSDGHDYLEQAVRRGASALVVEARAQVPGVDQVAIARVPSTLAAVSRIAAAFYGEPSRSLDVVGVTGTNGKTTTTILLAAILGAAGRPCGIIGTIGAYLGTRTWELANTTPLAPQLHSLLAEMREGGARSVAMEVSSHALALGRVEDVAFAVAAFTNLTRDHLDFHADVESYAAAKHHLLELAPACVLNRDDPYGKRWADEPATTRRIVTYALNESADLAAHGLELTPDASRFVVDGQRYELRLPGAFNVANALCAIACARLLGVDDAASARGLASVEMVPGRMQRLEGAGIGVIIDYAHTPDALEHALDALRATTGGRLLVVFGCGGDRDRGKRAEMGAVAARLADRVYITSDNPRSEDPQVIVDEILVGLGTTPCVVELDRRLAIERAVSEAERADVVLVAGKGHERYQIVGDRIVAFDDVQIARQALAQRCVPR